MTQVTVDLTRAAPYRLETSPDGNDLTSCSMSRSTIRLRRCRRRPRRCFARRRRVGIRAGPRSAASAAQVQTPPHGTGRAGGTAAAGQRRCRRPPRFTGNPVSLDFQGADLRAVLRTFAEISGLNIVIDPGDQGTVDVALRDVPWDQALDIILRANKLGYVVDGTIVRIAPLTVLADEEAQRRKLTEAQALAGELRVLTRSLSYARAEDLRRAAHGHGPVAARLDPDRRAHQHAHHHGPAGPARSAPAS